MAQDYYKHPSNYVWWVERNKLGLSQSTDGETFSGPDTVGLVVRIFCFKKGDTFSVDGSLTSSMTETTDIPPEFHEAIIAKTNELLFERSPEQLNTAQYWRDKYEKFIIEGKRYSNRSRLGKDIYGVKGDSY